MPKRHHGRDEAIIDPRLPIIDTHHHLFHRPNMRYLLDDFLADADAGHNIVASVYVETQAMTRADGPDWLKPLGEIEFANGMAAMSASGRYGTRRVAAGIIGFCDLYKGERIGELLDRAQAVAPDRLRGVRQMSFTHPSPELAKILAMRLPENMLGAPSFLQAFGEVASRGLSFEATVFHSQLGEVAALADAFPDTTIVLSHAGMAMGYGLDSDGMKALFADWRARMTDLAQRPNVICKIGGLGMPFWGFGLETRSEPVGSPELAGIWSPYVMAAIEAFGPDRCMMESNFPLEGVACGYVPLWNAMKLITSDCSDAEKALLFHDVARRVYRLELAESTGGA